MDDQGWPSAFLIVAEAAKLVSYPSRRARGEDIVGRREEKPNEDRRVTLAAGSDATRRPEAGQLGY